MTTTQLDTIARVCSTEYIVTEFITALSHNWIEPQDVHEQAVIVFRKIKEEGWL